jgi:hypothetical protein
VTDLLIPTRDNAPRFAVHELAYLLATRDDVNATSSRQWLGIPSAEQDREAVELGFSSLVARGLIEDETGSILPRNEAGLIGYLLGTATKWITVTARVGSRVDLVHFIQGDGVAVMARHAPADTIDFLLIKPDLDADDGAIASIERILGQDADLDLMLRSATLDAEQRLFARKSIADGWEIGHDPVFPGDEAWPAPELELHTSTRAKILAAAKEVIGHTEEDA